MIERGFLVRIVFGILSALLLGGCMVAGAGDSRVGGGDVDLEIRLGPVGAESIFKSEEMSIWGGSLVKGDDGRYHLYYSRWPKKLGWAWVTHSEVAYATGRTPLGPFEFERVVLPRRGAEYWDGLCTHNPTVHRFEGKYYLYYMGNTGDDQVPSRPGRESLNWVHRNNQRVGVAVADRPEGPWRRFDRPLIDVSADDAAPDSLMTSNPAVCRRPDGGYLMVYKSVGKQYKLPQGGPVVHCVATADRPEGPFRKYPKPIFLEEGVKFPAEDPYIWYQAGKYRAIVKKIDTLKTGKREFSLVQYDSADGFDWKPARYYLVSNREIHFKDGRVQRLDHLERPQVLLEGGKPTVLLCAADIRDAKNVRQSFNVQIPLIIREVAAESEE